ncbi:MAG: glutamate racemase [Crocinitomicaceae bacterium]|nr:glutamate racemase [Crocinitomicaceae bacterium]|tara:strand:- start:6297 stop:7094 length:798 start_codon:yes stop_codon:yes gene_type:complete
MNFSDKPIGIFDSGVGGLTVAKSIKEVLPDEQIIYFGDTLHLPYGEKSSHSIVRYSKQITQFLLDQGCKAIVIACNSASAHAYEATKECVPEGFPVINVIDPVVKHIHQLEANSNVGVIGTKATIRSKVYQDRISPIKISYLETPLLAAMVEEGFINNEVSQSVISAYLRKKELSTIDTLILGCTHYPLLEKDIKAYYNDAIRIIDSGRLVAQELKEKLMNLKLFNSGAMEKNDAFYVSDYTTSFEQTTKTFFGAEISLKELKIT